METYVLSVTLEIGIWALYSGVAYLTTDLCLRRYRRRRNRRYATVSTASSNEGAVELNDLVNGVAQRDCPDAAVPCADDAGRCANGVKNYVVRRWRRFKGHPEEEVTFRRGPGRDSRRRLISSTQSGGRDSNERGEDVGTADSRPTSTLSATTPPPLPSQPSSTSASSNTTVLTNVSSNDSTTVRSPRSPDAPRPAPPVFDPSAPFYFAPPTPLRRLVARHPRFRRSWSRLAKNIAVAFLFLLVGYLLTALSAIVIYASSEYWILYSDSIPCPNVTFDPNDPTFDPSAFSPTDEENCRYFFGPNDTYSFSNDTNSFNVTYEDLYFPVSAGRRTVTLHAWWIAPDPNGVYYDPVNTSVLLYTHGNADNISFFKKLYAFASRLGLAVFAWDFPGYGKSGGRSSERLIDTSANAAMAYLINQRKASPRQVVLWGYSLSGSVTANLAADWPTVRGVVMQAPIDSAADVVRAFLPLTGWTLTAVMTQRYDTQRQIHGLRSCLFQFVGDEDEMFPVAREKALFRLATKANPSCKKFFEVPGLTHLEDPLDKEAFRVKIIDYFDKIFKM